jgi:hypothetical protein
MSMTMKTKRTAFWAVTGLRLMTMNRMSEQRIFLQTVMSLL